MNMILFLGFGMTELLLILLVVLLLFGGRKIPELMRSLGKGVKSFRDEAKGGMDADNDNRKDRE